MTLLKTITAGIASLLLLTAAFTGCKKVQKTSQYTIGFSQCVGSDLWRRTMLEEMKMELSLHPGVKFVYADADNSSSKQIRQVKAMVDDGIDLLIISPNEAQPLTSIVEQTYTKGIPVVVIDRKTASGLYTAYVGANNYQIGKMAGEYASGLLKGKGNVLEVMGLPGSSPAIERDRGFITGLKKSPDIHVISQVYGDWLKDNAKRQLVQIRSSLGNVDLVFAQNDVMALGAKEVFSELVPKHRVKFIGVDAMPNGGLQMIDSKVIDASMLYPTGGKEAIATAFKILNKEPFLKENKLQTLVIDSTNVQLMKLQWNKVSSQQKDIERQKALLEEQRTIYNGQQVILNITVITLVLAVVFGGLAFYSLTENRKINKSLAAKNAEILSQRNKLIEMSVAAEAATEAKLNFFTNMSHEFRTPLTLMLSPVEDLMANDKLSVSAARNLKLIHKNVFRLLRLVNQLIDYRKIEYDKRQLNLSCNNIIPFVQDIVDCFRQNAKKRNISLNLISREPELMLAFDENMLDKVFFNLLSNALKFTNDNGRIDIILQKEHNGFVTIEVKDNGIGLAPEEAAHVFDQFYQADNALGKGSGLGLALSSEIVKLHKGTITVSSEKWKGTTFTVQLPHDNSTAGFAPLGSPTQAKSNPQDHARVYTTDLDFEKAIVNTDAFAAPKEHSILVIEDNTDLLYYLAEKLSSKYEIFTADNGTSGVYEAYANVPDLIISDVLLPGITGKNIAETLKTDVRTSHIPIILLTAQCSMENQIDGMQSMADAYITKPFNYDYLMATVKNLIQNRAILKEHFTSDISAPGKLQVSKSLDKKFVSDFAGIVEQNLSNENFNIDDISKAIGISRIQLYRKVKALMGCNISDYILNRRLKKAKYLLLHENYSISEVTYQVGFSSPNYFATVFKQKYNCTPSEFKRSQQNV